MALFQTREKDGTLWVRVTGYLTKDPKTFDKTLLFSICYDKKKYMDVKVWRSQKGLANLTSCLERHDRVAIDGKLESYTGKDGTQRWQVEADFIGVVGALPAASRESRDSSDSTNAPQDVPGAKLEEAEDDGEIPF